jgi:glycosyltransferase involved in cell wall biosynthesis
MGLKQGLGNVIDAARLADADTDTGGRVIFVLLGDGNQRELLKSRGADVKSLQFIDPLPDAEFQAVLAAADILLVNEMPGVTEMSVPSKLTSYFSMGKPVLAASSEKGTTAIEIARSNGGIRIDPGNPRGLLMSARSLANDPALAERLGHAGKQYCNDHLSENSAIDQYDSWINDLVRSWKGKG